MAKSSQQGRQWRQLGLQQITKEIDQVERRLQAPNLSRLDQLFWQGRRRELRAAAWLLRGRVPTSDLEEVVTDAAAGTGASPLVVQSGAALAPPLIERIFAQMVSGYRLTDNLTEQPLEIDILRQEKRQQLFQIVGQQLRQTLQELQANGVTLDRLELTAESILVDIWAASTTRFFGRYYTLTVAGQTLEVVPTLLVDQVAVSQQVLRRIPLTAELLGYLLWQQDICIDNRLQAYDTVPANEFVRDLLAHTVIQIANAVVQPFLNRFSDLEPVKQQFYRPDCLATRDIARFRNHLSWYYYLQANYLEPTAIFESRHQLLVFRSGGIQHRSIYAPRRLELMRLQGVPWLITMLLEVRDAVAPPWRSVTTFFGNVLVYVLTEVIGRGLGLVGRGIYQGLGQAWQDRR